MTHEHRVDRPASGFFRYGLDGVVGVQIAPSVQAPARDSGGESLGGLPGARLAAVDHGCHAQLDSRKKGRDSADVIMPLLAQGSVGIDLLGKGQPMLDEVQPHRMESVPNIPPALTKRTVLSENCWK